MKNLSLNHTPVLIKCMGNVELSTICQSVCSEGFILYFFRQEITVVNDSMSVGHIAERKCCKCFCHCKNLCSDLKFCKRVLLTSQEASLLPVSLTDCTVSLIMTYPLDEAD